MKYTLKKGEQFNIESKSTADILIAVEISDGTNLSVALGVGSVFRYVCGSNQGVINIQIDDPADDSIRIYH